MGALRLQVRDDAVPIAAGGAGRRTVVVSAGLVAAVRDRQLPVDQAAAVLGHGAGVVLSGAVRSDPALEFWTLPWQALHGLGEGLSRAFRWLPLVRWAVGGPDRAPSIRKILGAANTVAIGVAELRNAGFGTGHGQQAAHPTLGPRHARLAVNAAKTWCEFVLDTLSDPHAPWHNT